jgi:hypothetical protein
MEAQRRLRRESSMVSGLYQAELGITAKGFMVLIWYNDDMAISLPSAVHRGV